MIRKAGLAVALALLLATPVLAQEKAQEPIRITPQEGGWEIQDLFKLISEYTGESIVFDPKSAQIKDRTIEFVGVQEVMPDDLFGWFQSLLSFQRLVLVPLGPKGSEQWMAFDINAQQVTTRPIFVPEAELEDWADRDGVYIVSTITTTHLTDTSRARNALNQLSTQRVGRINDVPGSLSFVVADFAPVVVSMYQLLKAMDQQPQEYTPVARTYPLTNAVAVEVEPILLALLETDQQAAQQRRSQLPGAPEKPAPQIIADTRQDAIIVYAVPEDHLQIEELLRLLDQKVVVKRGNIHIRAIHHTNAQDIADLLTELIRGTGVTPTGTTRPRNQRPGAGPSSAGSLTGAQEEPVVVADDRTNSLIIQATATQLLDLEDIITQLDLPRDQVLVEAALVELSIDDLVRFGVELISATSQDENINERTFFGATQFGLSTLTDTNDDGIPDINIPSIAPGLIAGIYDNQRFPLLLQALDSGGRAQALSIPSVVVEDGKVATMKVEDEEPYQIRSTDSAGNTNFSVDFTQAEISLEISPHISSDNYLRLHIIQKVQSFGVRSSEEFPPPVTKREIETDIVVPDNYTVVMGGLIDKKMQESDQGIPYLRDIPILGYLFGSESKTKSTTSLFLFVTPHILKSAEATFGDYHRISWERKMTADQLMQSAVKIPHARFKGEEDPSLLDRIEESGYLDQPRYKATPPPNISLEEARRRIQESKKADQGADR